MTEPNFTNNFDDQQIKSLTIFIPSLMGGGAEKVIVNIANGLTSRGVKVDLVLVNAVGPYLQDLDINIKIIDLNVKRLSLSLIPLIKYLRSAKPQIVFSALTSANIIMLLARILSRQSFKLTISERAVSSAALNDNKLKRVKISSFLMKFLYPHADSIIAVAKGVAEDLINNFGIPPNMIKVIYNPVVTDKLKLLSKEKLTHNWFVGSDVPVITAMGRLTSQKNFKLLLYAFAEVLKFKNARLVILGSGEQDKELIALSKDLKIETNFLLPGFVNNPYSWLKNSSLFVLSSDYEGLPGSLIQAMACGTPVVSTNCPSGPDEILEGGKWGRLVPVGDVSALASAILGTLADKNVPDVKSRANFFNFEKGVDSYQKALGLN